MGSALERAALRRVLAQLEAAGVTLPPDLDRTVQAVLHDQVGTPGRLWAAAYPDDDRPPCCFGSLDDPEGCTCWRPVYEVEQAPPRPPAGASDLAVRPRMCGDCAFRPGSRERTDPLMAEQLMELPATHEPFWCHDGIRRPVRWEHPDGRTVPGDPADYHPATLGAVPYRADGSPALLCAGWAALAAKSLTEEENEPT